jgi:quercetin dioxygenase-like cupin family protein
MVEIGEGEVIFGSPKLVVTLLADIEQLAAVEVRSAPGWGNASPHVHVRHAEALFVFEGELTLRLEDRAHAIGPETWAFVPRGITHTFEVTGDRPARFLVLHAPASGFAEYIRGAPAAFDQVSPLDAVTRDPGLVLVRRTGGIDGDNVTNRPERRATVLVEEDELTISEFHYGAGERGAPRHIHREHADAFLVLEGEFTFHLRDGSHVFPAGTLAVFPPGVVHGFDSESEGFTRAFNFHVPSFGFADYMRGLNTDFDQFDPPENEEPSATAIVARLSV